LYGYCIDNQCQYKFFSTGLTSVYHIVLYHLLLRFKALRQKRDLCNCLEKNFGDSFFVLKYFFGNDSNTFQSRSKPPWGKGQKAKPMAYKIIFDVLIKYTTYLAFNSMNQLLGVELLLLVIFLWRISNEIWCYLNINSIVNFQSGKKKKKGSWHFETRQLISLSALTEKFKH
jgi:hypothetical protein